MNRRSAVAATCIIAVLAILYVPYGLGQVNRAISGLLANRTEQPGVHFLSRSQHLGIVRDDQGPIKVTYTFRNNSSTPLTLLRLATSCGCTQPDSPKLVTPPGQETRLVLLFEPKGLRGPVRMRCMLWFSDRPEPYSIQFTARVVPGST